MSNSVENLKLTAGAAKAPLGIVPAHALVGVARVLEDSGVKYAPGNFMAQPLKDALESYDNAFLRHRLACTLLSGLTSPQAYAARDEDSGLPHIDHMIAGLLILRSLMIRDGVLAEDPGIGKRKAKADADKAAFLTYRDAGLEAACPIQNCWACRKAAEIGGTVLGGCAAGMRY